jgi:hypothetical protein
MLYDFVRVGAVVRMRVRDYQDLGQPAWLVLREMGGKRAACPRTISCENMFAHSSSWPGRDRATTRARRSFSPRPDIRRCSPESHWIVPQSSASSSAVAAMWVCPRPSVTTPSVQRASPFTRRTAATCEILPQGAGARSRRRAEARRDSLRSGYRWCYSCEARNWPRQCSEQK